MTFVINIQNLKLKYINTLNNKQNQKITYNKIKIWLQTMDTVVSILRWIKTKR